MAQSTAVFSPQLFAGHTVFVSGGGSGIGKAIARAFLATGARVWIASRKEERLQEAVRELQEYGECHYAVLDIRDTEAIDNVVQQIRDKGHNIDILINNAGGQFPSPAEDISANGWHAVINNNLNGTWFMTKAFASNFFMQQHQGIVISIIANIYRGFPGMAHTGAARAGVENLTKSLSVEWAPYNIRLNALAPGIIRTEALDQYPSDFLKDIETKIPMKRMGTPEEVAHWCLFMACPATAYTTGETVYIDGGMRLWGGIWEVPDKEQG
jgi:citronellol/citronellal dehydrogenase